MNKALITSLVALTAAVFTQAVPINITMDGSNQVGDIAKNSNPTGSNSNSPTNHFNWLDLHVVPLYNANVANILPDPTGLTLSVLFGGDDSETIVPPTFSLTNIVYITLHYGKGKNGVGQGGGLVALYNNGETGSYTPPANGLGPNGLGGLSTVYAWGRVQVPDSGSSIALLGLGLIAILSYRRFKQ